MINFSLTEEGRSLLSSATEGTNPVLIDLVVLINGSSEIKSINEFSGSVVNDESGIGDYVVIDFNDITTTAYTITSIKLKSGNTYVAISEEINIVKPENKSLKLRITAQFDDAKKCAFNTTHINLPYATKFRDGVVRFANDNDTRKANTVYAANQVDTIVTNVSTNLTNNYVPWDVVSSSTDTGSITVDTLHVVDNYSTKTKTVTITTTNDGKLSIDKTLTGNVVSSSPTISNGAITTASSGKVVNEAYINSIYANEVAQANNSKLVTSYAVSTYVTSQISTASVNYVHMTGAETVAGTKTFSDGVVSTSYTGTGVQSETSNWNANANNSKLPTVAVVDSAITTKANELTTAYQNADTNLQSQIDALNAGQNLADIVDQISNLTSHSVTNLQARGKDNVTIGDKIQVLHDKTDATGTNNPNADGVATVYELVYGTIDNTTYPKDQASATTGYYWHYIGEYGCDSYSKSEADGKYVIAANLDQAIQSTSSTSNAPSTKAVYDHVSSSISTAGQAYVKLTSSTSQTIASPLVLKASSSATATLSIPDAQHITANNTITVLADGTKDVATEYNTTSGAFNVKLDNVTALSLTKTGTTSPIADVSGDLVASYRDSSITNGSLSDGRLVTVDYLNHFTGDMAAYAKLANENTFTGNTNTFKAVSATSYTGTGVYSSYDKTSWGNATTTIPTVSTVKSAMSDLKDDVLSTISTVNTIGSIGLFIYTEVGNQKAYGDTVNGQYLKPVGMTLPTSGQISYKAVATSSPLSGTWKLLSVACKRTATEPCLVLAQKISNS